ncbi:hypothetical protein SY88_03255 [Clostridiales bacterium PH28_bin88]|nr:hypothetical protein SY88_03255 [Clostridiales bacterium PH28_bin88]
MKMIPPVVKFKAVIGSVTFVTATVYICSYLLKHSNKPGVPNIECVVADYYYEAFIAHQHHLQGM